MTDAKRIKVWDIVVRAFHWSLVSVFIVAYLSGDDESQLHIYSGYGVLALVIMRILWGFIGTKHAKFTDFVYGPTETVRYIKSLTSSKPIHYLGHNPLGGWMVVALLVSLLGACWTGLEAYGAEGHGPLAHQNSLVVSSARADDDEHETRNESERNRSGPKKEDKIWEDLHEGLSNFALLLVFLHIGGVILGSAVHKENLIKAMITGYKIDRAP